MKLILSFLLASVCLKPYSQVPDSLHIHFEKELNQWTHSFRNFKLNEFKKTETVSFDNNYKQNLKNLHSFLAIYKPILTFSKDSSKFIDIYSYQLNLERKGNIYEANPEIDQAIYLFDKKSKYWNRIFFGSVGRWIDDVCWITNSRFILVGIKKNEAEKNAPIILLGNFEKKSLVIFENKNKSCIQKDDGYQAAKLKSLKIEGL